MPGGGAGRLVLTGGTDVTTAPPGPGLTARSSGDRAAPAARRASGGAAAGHGRNRDVALLERAHEVGLRHLLGHGERGANEAPIEGLEEDAPLEARVRRERVPAHVEERRVDAQGRLVGRDRGGIVAALLLGEAEHPPRRPVARRARDGLVERGGGARPIRPASRGRARRCRAGGRPPCRASRRASNSRRASRQKPSRAMRHARSLCSEASFGVFSRRSRMSSVARCCGMPGSRKPL